MDPITQGAFGALFAQTHGKSKNLAKASLIGCIAGMVPDLDVHIRSSEDSLLALEYHRHFTHSLFFIPFGGLLCSLILHPTLGRVFKLKFLQTLIWCVIGVATHGLVDSLTSYGTLLLWPFTDTRVAWDIVSIIDPLVTLPILGAIILSVTLKKKWFVFIGILWIAFYLGLASFQHHRAIEQGKEIAQERGLEIENIAAKPSFGNILIWKIITTTQDKFYVDAVKVGWGKPRVWRGESIEKLLMERDLPWIDEGSQQRKDIERFRWFSSGYIALDRQNPKKIVDVRYSLLPQQIKPLWGIELSETADQDEHAQFYNERNDGAQALKMLWGMLLE